MSLNIRRVLGAVADEFGVTARDITGEGRIRMYALPRHVAMYLAYRRIDRASLPSIGRAMGGRDHTTILHGVRKIAERIKTVPGLRERVERLEAALDILETQPLPETIDPLHVPVLLPRFPFVALEPALKPEPVVAAPPVPPVRRVVPPPLRKGSPRFFRSYNPTPRDVTGLLMGDPDRRRAGTM